MISLRRPTEAKIAAFAAAQAASSYSYAEVGATRGEMPAGYRIDRAVYEIGRGADDFRRGTEALRQWRHYDDPDGRIRTCGPRPALEAGANLVMLAHHLGLWTLSACRVVYVVDGQRRFGFAYGTLAHVVRGEELFEVRLADGGAVTFHLTAFSTPATLLTRLGGPITRHYQQEGGRSYARGLERQIHGDAAGPIQ